MLIRKSKPLEGFCEELAGQVASLDDELAHFKEHLSQQRVQYDQLKIRSAEYFHRAEMRKRENNRLEIFPDIAAGELSGEEIELELIKRKEALNSN